MKRQHRFISSQDIGRFARALSVLGLIAILSGCSNKVNVVVDMPSPLVESVPLNVHMIYTDEFKNQVYIEPEKKRRLQTLSLGQAQVVVFDTVFGSMANLVEADDPAKDISIQPEMVELQYTAPQETKLKQYDVFLRYRLKILNKDDTSLADWIIKGYGKTPTSLLKSASQAFNSAANVALRDVGAQLATRFTGQQKIKALVNSKRDATKSVSVADAPPSDDKPGANDE